MVRASLFLFSAIFGHSSKAGVSARKPNAENKVNANAAYEMGATALNLTANLIATTEEESATGLDKSDARFLSNLAAELSTQSKPQTQPGAKAALEIGVDALKLGAKLLEKTLPSDTVYDEQKDSKKTKRTKATELNHIERENAHNTANVRKGSSNFLPKEVPDRKAEDIFDSVAKGTFFDDPTQDASKTSKATLARVQRQDSLPSSDLHHLDTVKASNSAETTEVLKLDSSWGGPQLDQAPVSLKLIMKHMSKTGGSLMISLLNNMTKHLSAPNQYHFVRYVDELSPLTRSLGQRKGFAISSVRNPCDWYVDLWANTAEPDRQALNSKFGDTNDPEPFFDKDNLDAKKFANWMSWALDQQSTAHGYNIMSLRFWDTLIAGKHIFGGYNGQKLDEYMQSDSSHSQIESALASFSPTSVVDCWVSDESYSKDLRRCLSKYEQSSGAELDWEPFVERFGNQGAFDERFGLQGAPRGECLAYYTPEIAEAVLRGDKHMFEAFGYDTCCGAAQRPIA